MSIQPYPRDRTAYLLVDPYNDFLSEGGKAHSLVKPVADEVACSTTCASSTVRCARRGFRFSTCRTAGGNLATTTIGTIPTRTR